MGGHMLRITEDRRPLKIWQCTPEQKKRGIKSNFGDISGITVNFKTF